MADEQAAEKAETRRERFVRIAQKRTQQVLERLRILGHCANRSAYEYSPEDVDKIFATLQRELEDTRRKFDDRVKRRVEFTL